MSDPIPPAPAATIPWEDRDRLGFINAFVENAKLFIMAPGEAYARTPKQGDLGSPILWVVIVAPMIAVIDSLWSLLFSSAILRFVPEEFSSFGVSAVASVFQLVFAVIMAPFFAVIGLFIGAGVIHLCLMALQALDASEGGFEATVRALAYANVASVARLVPGLGLILFIPWALYLTTEGLARLHGTTKGRALAAVLIPFFLCCGCGVLFAIFVGATAASLF